MTNYFKKNSNQLIVVLVFLVLAIFSFFAMSKIYDAKPWFPGASQSLDDKKLEVMGLASSSAGASVAITLLPGDIGTTVADKMADLSGYFIMIVIVIYLEKFLMLFAGTLVFKVLIPVSCLAFIVGILFPRIRYWANQMGAKLLVMAVLFLFIIPLSVGISNKIDQSHQADWNQTIENAKQSAEEIQNSDQSILETVQSAATAFVETFKELLNDMIDAIAVLIVTSCLIPVLVILLYLWIMKLLFGFSPSLPAMPRGSNLTKAYRNKKHDMDAS